MTVNDSKNPVGRARGPSPAKTTLTRQSIVAAALNVFLERGYAGTRMSDVAERANLAKGTLYLYFADKEALFEGILKEVIGEVIGAFAASQPHEDETVRSFLTRTILPVLRDLETSRRASVIRIVIAEGSRFPALAAIYRRMVLDPAAGMIRELASRALATGEMQSDVLVRFPLILMSPAVVATIWNGLYGPDDSMDAATVFEAFLDLAFPTEIELQLPSRERRK